MIYLQIRKIKIQRRRLGISVTDENQRISLTYLLFSIVVTFFICNCYTPMYMLVYYNARVDHEEITFKEYKNLLGVIIHGEPLSYFLVTLNSSVNFILYYSFGSQFKKEFKLLFSFLFNKCKNTSSIQNSSNSQVLSTLSTKWYSIKVWITFESQFIYIYFY